jgi:DNA-binding transcriptional MerR regulator/effector-binding domain-containing protein
MDTTVTIGEFSRLSHLSAKALRHYHDVGLLIPLRIDSSGYRRYALAQVQSAQLISRLRRLDMPVPDIKAVLAAPDDRVRDLAIADHLLRMEDALGRTAQVVASLRALLGSQTGSLAVEYRTVPPVPVLGISARVCHADIDSWCAATFPDLYAALAAGGVDPAGPGGATYDTEFFEQDEGDVLAYVPVVGPAAGPAPAPGRDLTGPSPGRDPATGRAEFRALPGGRYAVALHQGAYGEIDRTYGALGSHVASHAAARPDPIREQYLIGPDHTPDPLQWRTEVWWPITTPVPAGAAPAGHLRHNERNNHPQHDEQEP